MNVGQLIKKYRKNKNFTLKDLSKRIDLSYPYLSQIETGSRNASPEILKKISEALEVSHFELMVSAGYLQGEILESEVTLESILESAPLGYGKEIDIAYLLTDLEFKLQQNKSILFEGHIITDKMRAILIKELNSLYNLTRSSLSEK